MTGVGVYLMVGKQTPITSTSRLALLFGDGGLSLDIGIGVSPKRR